MTEETKKTRKPPKRQENRPRIDMILRAIRDGRFDDDLNLIKGAIDDRNRKRQEAVLELVHQTFGEGYTVTPARQINTSPAVQGEDWKEAFAPPEGWVDTTEQATPPDDAMPGEDDPDIESRSPIIS